MKQKLIYTFFIGIFLLASNFTEASANDTSTQYSDAPHVASSSTDSLALVAIYNATDGANWYRNTNWLSSKPISTWFGVTTTSVDEDICRVEGLALFDNRLISLSSEIGKLTSLKTLNLSNTGLTILPSEIGNLTNLTYLDLSGNQLTILPAEIGNLTNLTFLPLHSNKLTILPAEIENLTNLRHLSLSDNQLTILPSEIGNLTNLKILDLFGNELTTLPTEIGNLTSLTYLYLSDNQLTILPTEVGNLASLRLIELYRNQLSGALPSGLLQVKVLSPCPQYNIGGASAGINPNPWTNYSCVEQ